MTDAFMIEVIAKRMDEECPWQDAQTVLQHRHWLDVVEHLWRDKKLKLALVQAYREEIIKAYACWLLENRAVESDGVPR
jgi:hypothetical protein